MRERQQSAGGGERRRSESRSNANNNQKGLSQSANNDPNKSKNKNSFQGANKSFGAVITNGNNMSTQLDKLEKHSICFLVELDKTDFDCSSSACDRPRFLVEL